MEERPLVGDLLRQANVVAEEKGDIRHGRVVERVLRLRLRGAVVELQRLPRLSGGEQGASEMREHHVVFRINREHGVPFLCGSEALSDAPEEFRVRIEHLDTTRVPRRQVGVNRVELPPFLSARTFGEECRLE
jgi:hypothetical protein